MQQRRDSALATSIQTITNADVKHVLHDSLREAKHQLNTGSERVPVEKFAQRRIHAAEKQLKKRIKRAQDAKQSDYAAYHEVRKAGKKVRYLLEFFEPAVGSGKGSHLKKLRRLQKRFRVRVARAGEELLGRCELDDAAEIHDGDAMR